MTVTAATAGDLTAAEVIAGRHPGWIVWKSRPTATRARTRSVPRNDGVFAMTVEAGTWPELDAKLAEQDQGDADAQARTGAARP
jgi:hypothetical protein